MATTSQSPLTAYLRRLSHFGPAEVSDRLLLERFATDQDESAFRALVRRHGPMVLGVCRRMLHHEQDAEDAFQATFLVLARKAGSLRRPEALAPWLYGVAWRIARKARSVRGRHRQVALEGDLLAAPESDPVWAEVRGLLDEAIQRLPARYRVPVVLCYLEGKTNAEAGRLLGLPRNTVATRLARARAQLGKQLTHRGVALSATALTLCLARETSARAVPPSLANRALRKATGAEAVSHPLAQLTKGVVNPMPWMKWKTAAVLVLALTGLAVGLGAAKGPRTKPPLPLPKADAPVGPTRRAELPHTDSAPVYIIDMAIQKKEEGVWKSTASPSLVVTEDRDACFHTGKEGTIRLGNMQKTFRYGGLSTKVRVKGRRNGALHVELIAAYSFFRGGKVRGRATFRTVSEREVGAIAPGEALTADITTPGGAFRITATVKEKGDGEMPRGSSPEPSTKEITQELNEEQVFQFWYGWTR